MPNNPLNLVGYLSRDKELKGTLSKDFVRGYSAYDIAVQNGFVGTEEEWLESLVGEPGHSPVVTAVRSGSSVTIYVDGTPIAVVNDGEDGHSPVVTATKSGSVTTVFVDGAQIATIEDGHSPVITATKSGSVTTISVDGSQIATIEDGHSPEVTASKSGSVTTIKVDGATVATVTDGEDGHSPSITATKEGSVTSIYVDSVKIAEVEDGTDGHSPVVTASKSGSVTTVSVDGTAIATINDGAPGHSPVVTATKTEGVTTIKVDGTAIATINDGDKGDPGESYSLHVCISGEYDPDTRVPTVQSPDESTIYLVPSAEGTSPDLFVEWVYVNNAWEMFGSASIDLSNYITDVEVDGTSVVTDGVASITLPDISGKADKVSSPTSGNFAGLDVNGNLIDSGHKHSDYLTEHQDISGKADKVSSPTSGNFAALDSNGNLTDSGHKHSDYLTEHQDISGKLDAPSTAGTSGQVLTSDGNGGQSWQTPSAGSVTDVQVNGESVVDNGVASISNLPEEATAQEILEYETRNADLTDSVLTTIITLFQNLPSDEVLVDIRDSISLECERLELIYDGWIEERT